MRLLNIPHASSLEPNHNNDDLCTGGIDAVIAHNHHKRNHHKRNHQEQQQLRGGPKAKQKQCGNPLDDGYDLRSVLS